jgi:hypothetical protein
MAISSGLGSSALLPAGLGFRNVLINGAMNVAQRGTSTASITTGGYYTCDRWYADITSAGTWTQTQSTDAPAGFGNSLKMQCTTAQASPSVATIQYRLEGQDLQRFAKGTSSAKSFTLSFWVKAFQTGTYIFELYDADNTRQCSNSYTVNTSATWEYKTIIFPSDTTGVFDNDNLLSMYAIFWLAASSTYTSGTLNTSWGTAVNANRAVGQTNVASSTSNYFQITGVQLEQNLQPTPFEQRPYGVELALCQRYYFRQQAEGTGNAQRIGGYGCVTGGNTFIGSLRFPVTMRTRPTGSLEYSGLMCTDNLTFDSSGGTWTIYGANYGATNNLMVYGNPLTSAATVAFAMLGLTNSTSSYIAISAEL